MEKDRSNRYISPRLLPLGRYRKTNMYQIRLEVCPVKDSGMDAHGAFSKTILYIADWLKAKAENTGGEEGALVEELFADYPRPWKSESFDTSSIADMTDSEKAGIRIVYFLDESPETAGEYWAVQIDQPGDEGNTNYITDISVKIHEDRVLLSVKGAIRLPSGSVEKPPYFRPAFLRRMVKDDKALRLVEYGVDPEYSFNADKAYYLNGRSDVDCERFRKGLLDNEDRKCPVFLITDEAAEKLGGEYEYRPVKPEEAESPDGGDSAVETAKKEHEEQKAVPAPTPTASSVLAAADPGDLPDIMGFPGMPSLNPASSTALSRASVKLEAPKVDVGKSSKFNKVALIDKKDIRKRMAAEERKKQEKEAALAAASENSEKDGASEPASDKPAERLIINAAGGTALCYAYVVVVEKSVRNLCMGTKYEQYVEALEQGRLVCVDKGLSETDFKKYFALNESGHMAGGFVEELRNGMADPHYDFEDSLFYDDILLNQNESEVRRMFDDEGMDPAKMKEEILFLQKSIDKMKLEKTQVESQKNSTILDLEEQVRKLKGENDKLRYHADSLENQKDELKKENLSMSEDMEKATSEPERPVTESMTPRDYFEIQKALFNPPAKYDKDRFPDWIEEYYSNTLIIHDNARKSLKDATMGDDRSRTLAAMIHYLYGLTLYWNEGGKGLDKDGDVAAMYDPFQYKFGVAPVGDKTLNEYKSVYSMDISKYDSKAGTVFAEQHLTYGVGHGDDQNLVRLYYHYDQDIKKSIIFSMPNHLPTFSGGR